MLKPDERKELERQVLQYALNGVDDFLSLKNLEIKSDSFKEVINKRIFGTIEIYFNDKKNIPECDQLLSFMIANNNSIDGLARYISSLSSFPYQEIPVKRLIEDNIEIETRQAINKANSEYGLDFAINLNGKISDIILKHTGSINKEKTTSETLKETIKKIQTGKPSNDYIKTGIDSLDKYIIGIPRKHLTIIGARPGQGKTTFALQLKRNFVEQGLKVGMFSLEMSSEELLIKDISAITEIDSLDIENNRLDSSDYRKIDDNIKLLKSENFVIDDNAFQTPQRIKAIINQWNVQKGIDVIIIDYLQLIKTDYKRERYDLEIGQLSNDLRIFAKQTGIPIIILSQLNRQNENRLYSRPAISDLRESGQIEQDAKLILLLYYPAKYGINVREAEFKKRLNFDIDDFRDENGNEIKNENYFQLIIGKARSGRTGSIHLQYLPQFNKFEKLKKITETDQTEKKINNEFIF
ncbi:MAG TPA: DnaB-like helicase C-terminal domain-containing protein [Ignavibacteriaceae bacterium]|nr:DnaB-like helicase C-terminal domain-containing protein [Ignavibacteriaceae bacterium]